MRSMRGAQAGLAECDPEPDRTLPKRRVHPGERWKLSWCRDRGRWRLVPNAIAEPYGAPVQHLAALERHLRDGSPQLRVPLRRVENARRSLRAIDRGDDGEADLIDETGAQERAVVATAALEQQALDPELAIEKLECGSEVELPLAGEEVGDTVLAQTCKMRIGDLLGQHHDDRVTADVGSTPGYLALRIQHDPVCLRVAAGEPGLAAVSPVRLSIVGLCFRKLLSGDPAYQPGLTADPAVQTLEEIAPVASARPPSAVQDAAVDARHHVADYVWLHGRLSYPPRTCYEYLVPTRFHR